MNMLPDLIKEHILSWFSFCNGEFWREGWTLGGPTKFIIFQSETLWKRVASMSSSMLQSQNWITSDKDGNWQLLLHWYNLLPREQSVCGVLQHSSGRHQNLTISSLWPTLQTRQWSCAREGYPGVYGPWIILDWGYAEWQGRLSQEM